MTLAPQDKMPDEQRAQLVALLDRLIPPNPARKLPGAGELGVAAFLEQQAADDPLVREAITRLLKAALGSSATLTDADVARLEAEQPDAFATLLRGTYMGYYSRGDVRGVLGLSASPTQPRGYDVPVEPPELLGSLLAQVKARGTCYRSS